jgi:hypothetical protein
VRFSGHPQVDDEKEDGVQGGPQVDEEAPEVHVQAAGDVVTNYNHHFSKFVQCFSERALFENHPYDYIYALMAECTYISIVEI